MRCNGSGTSVGASAHRVIRGGSWDNNARNVRAAYRNNNEPTNRNNNLGVRLCELTTELEGSFLNRPASRPSFP
jgi:formylglycine-generating enzyme required for sulfatase activity